MKVEGMAWPAAAAGLDGPAWEVGLALPGSVLGQWPARGKLGPAWPEGRAGALAPGLLAGLVWPAGCAVARGGGTLWLGGASGCEQTKAGSRGGMVAAGL